MTRRVLLLGICGALLASTCSAPRDPPTGSALEKPAVTELRILPVPPGEQWVLMTAAMHNVSPSPLELVGVHVEGIGLGSVVRVTRIQVAPLDPEPETFHTTPGGVFKTYPPAWLVPGEERCRVQTVAPVRGFVLQPDSWARILLVMHAEGTGKFRITAHHVLYRQGDGVVFTQTLPNGLSGSVSDEGRPMKPYKPERECLSETHLLPSGTAA